jgi:hypothetical protein
MLGPLGQITVEAGRVVLVYYESFRRDEQAVLTIVAVIHPGHNWAVYWEPSSVLLNDSDMRVEHTRWHGHKVNEDVARAMFPHIESEYEVTWRP